MAGSVFVSKLTNSLGDGSQVREYSPNDLSSSFGGRIEQMFGL